MMANVTTEQQFYNVLKANPKMIKEIDFKAWRTVVRKNIKPEMIKAVQMYHVQKLAAFKTQKACFLRLMKIHVSMQCAAMNANQGFIKVDDVNASKKYMYVKKSALTNFTKVCMKSVNAQIMLGNAYTEVSGEMYAVTRYPGAKKVWISWKKMLNNVAKSDMRMNTLLNMVVYEIFDEGKLWDQMMTFQKAEATAMLAKMNELKLWEFNMKLPENCSNDTCQYVKNWVNVRGVNDDAADMKNFQNSNHTFLAGYNADVDMFHNYEKAFEAAE